MKTVKVFGSFIGFLIIVAGLFIGCSNAFNEFSTTDASNTPFASRELLEDIAQNDTFIHWKVARFFALNELDDSSAENSWAGAWLSEFPLVIYNTETGNPRYYEFRVLQGNKEVGAITCAADKGEGSPVQFVLPFVHEVGSQNARALAAQTGKFIDSGYPGRLLVQEQNGGYSRAIGTEADIGDVNEYPADAKALDVLLNASKEELALLGIDSDEMYERYLAVEQEKAEQLALFWQEVDALNDKITNMTEEELREAFNTDSGAARNISTSHTNTFFLNDWYNKSGWYNPGSFCGPNVIAFIMLGLGPKSGYANIPTSNDDYSQLRRYYQTIQNEMGEGMQWPISLIDHKSLDGWLRTFTGGRYGLSLHFELSIIPPFIIGHDWGFINSSLHMNQLPVVSCRIPKELKGFFDGSGCHYRTIIGTREAITTLSAKILWWTVNIPIWSEGQYLMHDNGAEKQGNAWWEGWNLYQWFAMSVVKN